MKKLLLPLLLLALPAGEALAQIGIYDLQLGAGVNWTKPKKNMVSEGDFGTDWDAGLTLVNLSFGKKSWASALVEAHYDYSRQNFEANPFGSYHFRRHEGYARIRPVTVNPTLPYAESGVDYVLLLLLTGFYADIGYSSGTYYYRDYLEERQAPDYEQKGMFWGWGWNLRFRTEGRTGISGGYGSKIYQWQNDHGKTIKYSSRSFSLAFIYYFR